ncbi:hypothetical protein BD779DRAFT_1233462 [Infundibulicybe gibba]|nr:hypothetical protein BD779DRAFT_1233462 [Infundibulicybe gibba]
MFVRIWGDHLKKLHIFSMDFVDRHGAYIRTPRGMKIIMLNSPSKDPEVYTSGRALELADPTNDPKSLRNFHRTGLLPNWETYVVAEGARICIRYPGIDDYYFDIPFHQPQTVETTLGYYRW